MTDALHREASIEVGQAPAIPGAPTVKGIKVDKLACDFKIFRDVSSTPNTADVTIYNLKESSRKTLLSAAKQDGVICRISAGYRGSVGLLYHGVLQDAVSYQDGVEWVTALTSSDGAETPETDESTGKQVPAKMNLRLTKLMPVNVALQKVVEACGLNLSAKTSTLAVHLAASKSTTLQHDVLLTGPAKRALARFANATNLDWSVQDGTFEGALRGSAFETTGPLLQLGGTLIRAQVTANGDVAGAALLDHRLRPGTQCRIRGATVDGAFTLDSVTHTGDLSPGSQSWETEFTGVPA